MRLRLGGEESALQEGDEARLTARTLAGHRVGLHRLGLEPRSEVFGGPEEIVRGVGQGAKKSPNQCEFVVASPTVREIPEVELLESRLELRGSSLGGPRRPQVPRPTKISPETEVVPRRCQAVPITGGVGCRPATAVVRSPVEVRKKRPRSSAPTRFSYLDEAMARLRATALPQSEDQRPFSAVPSVPAKNCPSNGCPSCRWTRGHRCSYCLLAKSSATPRLTLGEVGARLLKKDAQMSAKDLLEKLERYGRLSDYADELNDTISTSHKRYSKVYCSAHADEKDELENVVERQAAEVSRLTLELEAFQEREEKYLTQIDVLKMGDRDNDDCIASMTRMLSVAAAEERRLKDVGDMCFEESLQNRQEWRVLHERFSVVSSERTSLLEHNDALVHALAHAEGCLKYLPRLRRRIEKYEEQEAQRPYYVLHETQTPKNDADFKALFADPNAKVRWVTRKPGELEEENKVVLEVAEADSDSDDDDEDEEEEPLPRRPAHLAAMLPSGKAKVPVLSAEDALEKHIYDVFDASLENLNVTVPEVVRRVEFSKSDAEDAVKARNLHAFVASIRKLLETDDHPGWLRSFAIVAGLETVDVWSPLAMDVVKAVLKVAQGKKKRKKKDQTEEIEEPPLRMRDWAASLRVESVNELAIAVARALRYVTTPSEATAFFSRQLSGSSIDMERAVRVSLDFYAKRSRLQIANIAKAFSDTKTVFCSDYCCTFDDWAKTARTLLSCHDLTTLNGRLCSVWRCLATAAAKRREALQKKSPPKFEKRRRQQASAILAFEAPEFARACYAHELFIIGDTNSTNNL